MIEVLYVGVIDSCYQTKQVSEEEDVLLARLEEYFSQASFTESVRDLSFRV